MDIKIKNKNGITLNTAGKYCDEDINISISDNLFPKGTLEITENGEHNVSPYAKVNVNVNVNVEPETPGEVEATYEGTPLTQGVYIPLPLYFNTTLTIEEINALVRPLKTNSTTYILINNKSRVTGYSHVHYLYFKFTNEEDFKLYIEVQYPNGTWSPISLYNSTSGWNSNFVSTDGKLTLEDEDNYQHIFTSSVHSEIDKLGKLISTTPFIKSEGVKISKEITAQDYKGTNLTKGATLKYPLYFNTLLTPKQVDSFLDSLNENNITVFRDDSTWEGGKNHLNTLYISKDETNNYVIGILFGTYIGTDPSLKKTLYTSKDGWYTHDFFVNGVFTNLFSSYIQDTFVSEVTSHDLSCLISTTPFVLERKAPIALTDNFDGTPLISTSNTVNIEELINNKKIPLSITFNSTNSLKAIFNHTKRMSYMFYKNPYLTSIEGLIDYNDTENVEFFSYAFSGCTSLAETQNLNISKAISLSYMYQDCTSLKKAFLLNTGHIQGTGLQGIFSGCTNLKHIKLNTEGVNTYSQLCTNCYNLIIADLSDVGGGNDDGYMGFKNCYSLKALIFRTTGLYEDTAFSSSLTPLRTCYRIVGTTDTTYNPEGLKDGYIYVPRQCVEVMQNKTCFQNCSTQFRALEDYTIDGTITGELDLAKMGISEEELA